VLSATLENLLSAILTCSLTAEGKEVNKRALLFATGDENNVRLCNPVVHPAHQHKLKHKLNL
jgi:hypothetical protein